MSTEELADGALAQNDAEDGFVDTQNQQVDTSKLFSKAYNEGKSKLERDVMKMMGSLGIEDAESIEDGFSKLGSILSPKKENKNEVDELRRMLEEATKRADDVQGEFESFVQQAQVERSLDESLSKMRQDSEVSLKDDHLKALFSMEYEVEERDGNFIAIRNGAPVLDNKGDYRSIGDVLRQFALDNKYASPAARGAGGSSGSASPVADKPSRSEFRSLLRQSNSKSQERAAELFALSRQVGWAE